LRRVDLDTTFCSGQPERENPYKRFVNALGVLHDRYAIIGEEGVLTIKKDQFGPDSL
jgi:hypothetical protein